MEYCSIIYKGLYCCGSFCNITSMSPTTKSCICSGTRTLQSIKRIKSVYSFVLHQHNGNTSVRQSLSSKRGAVAMIQSHSCFDHCLVSSDISPLWPQNDKSYFFFHQPNIDSCILTGWALQHLVVEDLIPSLKFEACSRKSWDDNCTIQNFWWYL